MSPRQGPNARLIALLPPSWLEGSGGYLRQRTRVIVLGDTLYDRPNSRTDYPSAFRFRTSSC